LKKYDRAMTLWTKGMENARSKKIGGKTYSLLERARQAFIELEASLEIAVISVDIAFLEYPNRIKVRLALKTRWLTILGKDLRARLNTIFDATRVDRCFGDPNGKVHKELTEFRKEFEGFGFPRMLSVEAQPEHWEEFRQSRDEADGHEVYFVFDEVSADDVVRTDNKRRGGIGPHIIPGG